MTLSGAENGTRTRDLNLGKECCSKTLKDSVFQGYATVYLYDIHETKDWGKYRGKGTNIVCG